MDKGKNSFSDILPRMAFKEIPEAKENAKEITALIKSGYSVVGYQLSDGTKVDKQQAVSMAKQGDIKGVGIASNKGTEYLKSLPDDTEQNNLSNLPSIPQ